MFSESPIKRRKSRQIMIGQVPVGGDAPISVQSMTNTETTDVASTVAQINRIQEAGADIVGGDDLAEQIQKGEINFDVCIATPDMMAVVGKIGKILGPRGLMPNPKLGTVSPDVEKAVKAAKSIDDNKIAEALRKGTFKTVMGSIKFGKKGEWAEGRMMAVQYHGITDAANLETWRGMSYQTVVYPPSLQTGKVSYPYDPNQK